MDFSAISVLCVGDVMLDRFIYGDMDRISPEAPVPVLRLTRTRDMLGGAGNVASNVASLGGRAVLVGLLGRDASGALLQRIVAGGAIVARLVESSTRPTICKARFIAARQQVIRADEESLLPLLADEEREILGVIDAEIGAAGAVILSDYGKGLLTQAVIARVMHHARATGIPVFVDPKSRDFSRYRGATCITPNLKELAAASGLRVETEEQVAIAARKVMAEADAASVLATRSEKGMLLVEAGGGTHAVPARAREVFDVSGAGDTVIATLALAHAAGRSMSQAMHIANAAAGVVVSKLGTATADVNEIMQELDAQEAERAGNIPPGLQVLSRVRALVDRWREQGLRVGVTNGCFDLLHPGHVALLAAARAECDRLVVALNSDASVRRLKGPTRPVNTLDARAQVIAAIRYVDAVVGYEEDTPLELIRELQPDVLVKGADWAEDAVVGGDLVRARGGRVVLARLVAGESTTGTIARING